mgnify:CR=1 FL=1
MVNILKILILITDVFEFCLSYCLARILGLFYEGPFCVFGVRMKVWVGECRGRFGRVVKLIGGVGVLDWVFVEVGSGRVIEFSGYTVKQYSYRDDEQFPYID